MTKVYFPIQHYVTIKTVLSNFLVTHFSIVYLNLWSCSNEMDFLDCELKGTPNVMYSDGRLPPDRRISVLSPMFLNKMCGMTI